uniref:histidine--tRNA ligase n=1 Tax=Leachiella pacifica TaxID=282357 RepID=A0A3S8UVV8_9FLOR|nr:histidine-tRNA ligase [Leachiella pacifica]
MQPLRGTKDILPTEIQFWQKIRIIANKLFNLYSYKEIQTPILESAELFYKSIGDSTDIVYKEMYSFNDQGKRLITLRPEGTASIARAFISNKLYLKKHIHRLWYIGPMFRYERPQKGRQRQFHQLGIECMGSAFPIAEIEVIELALKILNLFHCTQYNLEINSIGNLKERSLYQAALVSYFNVYENDLDEDSLRKLKVNPLRLLDSKNKKIQEMLIKAPNLNDYLEKLSIAHFDEICQNLTFLNIPYIFNKNLVRGLDYYNYTAFEIKTKICSSQNTICGGGRYDKLITNLGGPNTPSVGWAIGVERLISIARKYLEKRNIYNRIYIIIQKYNNYCVVWDILNILEIFQIEFQLDLSDYTLLKQLRQANQIKAKICFILGENEIYYKYVTIKWLQTNIQQRVNFSELTEYLKYLKYYIKI